MSQHFRSDPHSHRKRPDIPPGTPGPATQTPPSRAKRAQSIRLEQEERMCCSTDTPHRRSRRRDIRRARGQPRPHLRHHLRHRRRSRWSHRRSRHRPRSHRRRPHWLRRDWRRRRRHSTCRPNLLRRTPLRARHTMLCRCNRRMKRRRSFVLQGRAPHTPRSRSAPRAAYKEGSASRLPARAHRARHQ
jgi:hypothetical protein